VFWYKITPTAKVKFNQNYLYGMAKIDQIFKNSIAKVNQNYTNAIAKTDHFSANGKNEN
jgi:hypothetical protein